MVNAADKWNADVWRVAPLCIPLFVCFLLERWEWVQDVPNAGPIDSLTTRPCGLLLYKPLKVIDHLVNPSVTPHFVCPSQWTQRLCPLLFEEWPWQTHKFVKYRFLKLCSYLLFWDKCWQFYSFKWRGKERGLVAFVPCCYWVRVTNIDLLVHLPINSNFWEIMNVERK